MGSRSSNYMRDYESKRGYIRHFPELMASADLEFQSRLGALADIAYQASRRLSAREKELILIAILAARMATSEHMSVHLTKALQMGIDERDILEALELLVVPCGVTPFEMAVELLNTIAPLSSADVTDGRRGATLEAE